MEQEYKGRMRIGTQTLIGLVVFDAVEYWVGVAFRRGATLFLAVLAIPQAWLIVRYFMHVQQLRRGGEA